MEPSRKRLALVFGLWTLVAIVESVTDFFYLRGTGRSPFFWASFKEPLLDAWIWAVLTPVVFLIARRFPLSRPGMLRACGVHVFSFLTLSYLHCTMVGMLQVLFASGPAAHPTPGFGLRFLQEIYSDIWMYWPLVCIQALIDSQARRTEQDRIAAELDAELTKSRLTLLRAQIQPHFLFNTLQAISALISIDLRAAEDMIADLGDLLRAAFSDPYSQESSLRPELELVKCYLRIQCRRFDRLQVIYAIDTDTLDALVPALVLQSLVENAVIHGISPVDRPCTIVISSRREDARLVLRVTDDGAGVRIPHREGVGLSNARRRLQQLYGVDQTLDLSADLAQGASVVVSIPLRFISYSGEKAITNDANENADRGRRAARTAQPVVTAQS